MKLMLDDKMNSSLPAFSYYIFSRG